MTWPPRRTEVNTAPAWATMAAATFAGIPVASVILISYFKGSLLGKQERCFEPGKFSYFGVVNIPSVPKKNRHFSPQVGVFTQVSCKWAF